MCLKKWYLGLLFVFSLLCLIPSNGISQINCDCYEPIAIPTYDFNLGRCAYECTVVEPGYSCLYLIQDYDVGGQLVAPFYPNYGEQRDRELINYECTYWSGQCSTRPCPTKILLTHWIIYNPCIIMCP